MNLEEFRTQLAASDALRETDQVIADTVECVRPKFADHWPSQLHPDVRAALIRTGIERPYQHQADAIARSLGGSDVVLESPTASGKTIAFAAPLLDSIRRDRTSHALMIYPMKALAFDQRAQIDQICQPLSIESFPYDADTPKDIRDIIRKRPPHILLTNPEYLNMTFLGWREQWVRFLQGLKYVVIDEMHEYRGFFGGNMALLLRRFFLHLREIGASPRVFLSTATCANPVEHARNLTGREVEAISASNVFRPRRHFLFVRPDIPDYRYREILQLRVEQAAMVALERGLQTLVFCPTKRFLEDAFRNCRRKAEEAGWEPDVVSAFHADLKSETRQDIQRLVKEGTTRVVFTTNALELGLDIGGLDGVILAGFPPSVMSAWQQIGRAGRRWDEDAFVLFFAMNDPIDRFFVGNLRAFLNKPLDELIVDPSNETLIGNHLPMIASETNGDLPAYAEDILGRAFFSAAKANKGRSPRNYRPHPRLKMRGGIGESFNLKIGSESVGQVSAIRRFKEAYIGAIFTFFGRKYVVRAHEEGSVVLADTEQHLKTEARFFTIVTTNEIFEGVGYGDLEVYYGSLTVVTNFTGYRVVDERSGEVTGEGSGDTAHYQNNLHALWINVLPDEDALSGIAALEHLIRVGAMFVIPADRFDTSTYSKSRDEPVVFYYENYSGGIGVAKKLYGVWETALGKGIQIAEECGCRRGCQYCIEPAKSYNISNENIDKESGIRLARGLLMSAQFGADHRFDRGQMIPE